ncbi:MAG: hypothetical protein OJF60_002186 [Burkholderiaceae bacterium]|jgi:hypothetical protein|nr:MAG: hypothetical protein OJF60_002186 [Burkholderiaceae bacterium]
MNTTLEDVCAVIGFTATQTLIDHYGGDRLYVPLHAREDHPLAQLIGLPAMRRLIENWGAESLFVPAGCSFERDRRNAAIRAELLAGSSPESVAERHGLTPRRVRQLRARLIRKKAAGIAAGG